MSIPPSVAILGGSWFKRAGIETLIFETPLQGTCFETIYDRPKSKSLHFIDRAVRSIGLNLKENSHLKLDRDFVVDANHSKMVGYVGDGRSVFVWKGIKVLGECCFSWCQTIEELAFEPESELTEIEELCFQCCSLKSVCIPRSASSIGKSCFAGGNIESLAFEKESQLTRIEDSCFKYCTLKSICIPPSVAVLPKSCFRHAKIDTIAFDAESQLNQIGAICFANCSIKSISIPRSVQVLGKSCFQYAHIETMRFQREAHLTRIEASCFLKCRVNSLSLPRNIDFIDDSAFARSSIELISADRSGLKLARFILSWIWG
jgi:hypothetical protein